MISHDLYALVSKLKVAIGSSLIALKYVVLIFEQSCLGTNCLFSGIGYIAINYEVGGFSESFSQLTLRCHNLS